MITVTVGVSLVVSGHLVVPCSMTKVAIRYAIERQRAIMLIISNWLLSFEVGGNCVTGAENILY